MAPGLMAPLFLLIGCGDQTGLKAINKELLVTPEVLDFGDVALGATATDTVDLAHVAGGEITVLSVELDNIDGEAFSTTATGMIVAVDGTATVDVSYAPTDSGWHYAQLKIYTDEEENNEHLVDVRGHGATSTLVITPALLDFGPVDAAVAVTDYVTISNVGTVAVTLESAAFSEAIFTSSYSLPASIDAGQSLDFPIDALPADDEPVFGSGTLVFTGAEAATVDLRVNACADGDPDLYDVDGDGFSACAGDCDDNDPSSHPGGSEVCDGLDQDCDDVEDDGTECFDDDGDGFTEEDGDCVDADSAIKPGAAEDFEDGVDNDCDGTVDSGTDDPDGDGFSGAGGDCETLDERVYPGAAESADGVDNDCDGLVDEGTDAYDDDGDGFAETDDDCDDSDDEVNPSADEEANGVDDDCNGEIDEGTDWGDDDGDGWSERGGDCDDDSSLTNPGAYDSAGDGVDSDCDGGDS